jgi:hypothetical protein
MKIYLAGPMRGYAEHNFPKFAEVTARLRKAGHTVFSPAEADITEGSFDPKKKIAEQDFDMKAAFLRDVHLIAQCDTIVLLPGWLKSVGAVAEAHCGAWLGIDIFVWCDGVCTTALVPLEWRPLTQVWVPHGDEVLIDA